MIGKKIDGDFEGLLIVAEWESLTNDSDPLIKSWRERVKQGKI